MKYVKYDSVTDEIIELSERPTKRFGDHGNFYLEYEKDQGL